jgi:hypothetical protein
MGDKLTHVYLPHSGVISLLVELRSGIGVEAAMVGNDGMPVLDGEIALSTAVVQEEGEVSMLVDLTFVSLHKRAAAF